MDTKNIIIQGQTFTASLPYAAGQALTESEARALNQVRLENIRNNFASKVKASLEKRGPGTLKRNFRRGAIRRRRSGCTGSRRGLGNRNHAGTTEAPTA